MPPTFTEYKHIPLSVTGKCRRIFSMHPQRTICLPRDCVPSTAARSLKIRFAVLLPFQRFNTLKHRFSDLSILFFNFFPLFLRTLFIYKQCKNGKNEGNEHFNCRHIGHGRPKETFRAQKFCRGFQRKEIETQCKPTQ